jgi:hypothetical protein
MISATYIGSGALLAITAALFNAGLLNAATPDHRLVRLLLLLRLRRSQRRLPHPEIFPLEVRAKAIAVFFAIAQCFGAIGPVQYGAVIGTGTDPFKLFIGYLIGGIMIGGGVVELLLGVPAQGKSLDAVAQPLSAAAP